MVLFPDARRAVEVADAAEPMWAEGYEVAAARAETLRLAAEEPREEVAEARDIDADGVPLPPVSAISGRRRGRG